MYNGRDGVVTDDNGLIYMRARYYSPELRRFVNADILAGEISNAVTLNRYAYANGNPVSNIDPLGLAACGGSSTNSLRNWAKMFDKVAPTPLEAAYMAKHIYDATDDMKDILLNVGDYKGINNWRLEHIEVNEQGMKIGVYYNVSIWGTKSYALVNAGTSTHVIADFWGVCSDWGNNLSQPFGNSQDMKDSIEFAQNFVKENEEYNITFVGHSKGGAEAAANAVATGRNAILFNPAMVNLSAYGLSSEEYNADMTAYIVEGEVLNAVFAPISSPIDEARYLKEPWWESIISIADDGIIPYSLDLHSMDTVIDLLE